VKEIFDFHSGELRAKSSALAEVVLREFTPSQIKVDALVRTVELCVERRFEASDRGYNPYADLHAAVMKFSNLQRIFSLSGRYEQVFSFYERVKHIPQVQRNPQFWLQYAVARTASGYFEHAEKYFETAYAWARKIRGYDVRYIDNHYARFLLANEIERGSSATCMSAFKAAAKIVRSQMRSASELHYPYRVASLLLPFLRHFQDDLSPTDKHKISALAAEVVGSSRKLPPHSQRHPYVIGCIADMGIVQSLCGSLPKRVQDEVETDS
jgi:tetratricopeptide (TPR) repeat protein